jgi:tRNA dimethylallyltransferase
MSQEKMILIAGPTASGKSAFALDLARRHDGVIINADAMQVYEGLPVLTAQPSAEDRMSSPHELYGCINPEENFSAGKWVTRAHESIRRTLRDKRLPIVVGGTGLYFRALLGGLAEIPPIPDQVRDDAQNLYDDIGEEKFRAALRKLDPLTAEKLARNDRQRLIRAYEVAKHTGKALGEWHALSASKVKFPSRLREGNDAKGVMGVGGELAVSGTLTIEPHLILPPRDQLYAACDKRFTYMIEQGAVDEVRAFLQRGLNPILPAMKTIGVREIGAYLAGAWTLDEAITKAQQMTRNYAKRQLTWFRNQKLIPEG